MGDVGLSVCPTCGLRDPGPEHRAYAPMLCAERQPPPRYPGSERDWKSSDLPRPLFVRHADALYKACEDAIRAGRVDARSKIGDAVLDYQQYRDEMAARPVEEARSGASETATAPAPGSVGTDPEPTPQTPSRGRSGA